MGFGTGGFGIGGMLFGGGDGPSDSTLRRRGRYVLSNILEPSDREAFGKAQRQFEAVPGTIKAGYKLARKEVGSAFRGASRAAIDQGRVEQGDALQRMTNAGFSGSGSIANNLRVGIGYRTSRAIQDIQDRVAQIGANLATEEAGDLATAQQGLGRFYMQRGLADRERNMLHWQLLTGGLPSQMAGQQQQFQSEQQQQQMLSDLAMMAAFL
jgi:hypothetical protein